MDGMVEGGDKDFKNAAELVQASVVTGDVTHHASREPLCSFANH